MDFEPNFGAVDTQLELHLTLIIFFYKLRQGLLHPRSISYCMWMIAILVVSQHTFIAHNAGTLAFERRCSS